MRRSGINCPGALGRVKGSLAALAAGAPLTRPARSLRSGNYRSDAQTKRWEQGSANIVGRFPQYMPPTLRTFISPEEVYPGRVVTYQEVAAVAGSLNRDETLHFLGFLNLVLSSATAESHLSGSLEPVRDVQHWLFREVVSERLLADLKVRFRDASLLDRPILHRTQILFAIRTVATHGNEGAGNRLVDRGDFDTVGDLLFLINGLFTPAPLTADDAATKALWVATDMGPLHELENPPPLELTWPRTAELLTTRLPAAVEGSELKRLEQTVVFSSGFSLLAWVDLNWLLMSYWLTIGYRELMTNRARGYLGLGAPHSVISIEALSRAVDVLAVKFDDLATHLRIDQYSRRDIFDLTPFRTKPLWLLPDGAVLCIDSTLLMERLGPHVFWSVMNALDGREPRQRFSRAWGLAFEDYALTALADVFGSKAWQYARNPIDEETGEELWDGLASRDTTAMVIECKGTFVRSSEKYSGVPRQFFRGLSTKFGRVKGGGVYQLACGVSKVWFERSARGPLKSPDRVTDVFPVLVVQDPILDCGPVVRVLSDRFAVAIERLRRRVKHKAPKIWPLTVVTADELDVLRANLGTSRHRLDAVLKSFHRRHPSRMVSLGDFLSSKESRTFGFPDSGRESIQQRFRSGADGSVQRFRDGEYGVAVDILGDVAPARGDSI